MSYQKASCILPPELLEQVQSYVDGACIYIPRKENCKHEWGTGTAIRHELALRNRRIYEDYKNGNDLEFLSSKYYLSVKSIQRVILQQKRK